MQSLEWITDQTRFAAIARDWDRLALEHPTPFLTSAWLNAWLAAFAGRHRLLVATLWRDGDLVAGIPLLSGWRHWRAPANDHSPAFGLLAADNEARERLVEEMVARSNALTVPGLADDDPALLALDATAQRAGRWTFVKTSHSLEVATAGSLQDYRADLSAKARSELGRLRRKAERERSLDLRLLGRPADLDNHLSRVFALEASGWKGRAELRSSAPSTPSSSTGASHANSTRRGSFRISELLLDGELAAMALSIVHQRRLFTLKVGYDESRRRFGPGLVLLMAMIERCFELGLDAYDFSGPDQQYERRFATDRRTYHRVLVYRRNPGNAARYAYRRHVRPSLRVAYHRARRAGAPDLRGLRRRLRV